MNQKHRGSLTVWLSLLTLAVISIYLYLFTNIQYCLNDDTVLMRSFAGNVGGVMETFNMFTHTLLAYPLHWLSVAFPLVAWYSVAQVAMLWIAAFSMLCSVQTILLRMEAKPWLAWLASTLNLLCFGMVFMTSITFTTTVALLSAAAVWKALEIDFAGSKRHITRDAVASFTLLAFGYMLRSTAALPGVCFWVLALLCRALIRPEHTPPLRAPLKILLFGLLALGALYLIRIVDMALSGEQAYIRWMNASVAGMDYGGIRNADIRTLQTIGWTEKERALVLDWYFMEDNITADSFAAFVPFMSHGTPAGAISALAHLLTKSRNMFYFTLFLGLSGAGALLCAAIAKPFDKWALLLPLATGGAALVGVGGLAYMGRLPMRAAATVMLPACALMLWLCFTSLHRLHGSGGLQKAVMPLLALCLCLAATKCLIVARSSVYNPVGFHGNRGNQRYEQLETYALSHPDQLLIADNAFNLDSRLFPDWRKGKATNILYAWGGWNNHSAGYRAVMRQYGLDHEHFTVLDFCRANVRLITGGDAPPDKLMDYLLERSQDKAVAHKDYTGDGFTVFSFHLADESGGESATVVPDSGANP